MSSEIKVSSVKAKDGTAGISIADSTGKVGVGTSSPSSALNVSDSAGTTTLIVTDPTRNASGEHWYLRNTGGNFYIGQSTDSGGAWDSLSTRVTIDTSGNLKFNSGFGSVETAYGCRAWCSFVGTGTPSINNSGNVSSLTDHGTGQISINFTSAMPDINYVTAGACGNDTDVSTVHAVMFGENSARTTSACRFTTMNAAASSATLADESIVNIAIFR
jgi:hypothetical protein